MGYQTSASCATTALARYKASLLGQAAQAPGALAADPETRRVVIHELRIIVAGRPDIVLPLDTPERVLAVESQRLVVKEGLAFSTKLIFSVHHDVVLGLRFAQKVTRLGVTCDTINIMIGSCACISCCGAQCVPVLTTPPLSSILPSRRPCE